MSADSNRVAVATTSQVAADAAAEIAELGGNAVDCGIAASFCSINTQTRRLRTRGRRLCHRMASRRGLDNDRRQCRGPWYRAQRSGRGDTRVSDDGLWRRHHDTGRCLVHCRTRHPRIHPPRCKTFRQSALERIIAAGDSCSAQWFFRSQKPAVTTSATQVNSFTVAAQTPGKRCTTTMDSCADTGDDVVCPAPCRQPHRNC